MDRCRLLRVCALVALALLPSLEATALGLGRASGAVVLGRPLSVAIAATHEAGDPDTPCVAADVFQGDTRVSPRLVGVRWEAGAAGQGTVRITADPPIEEPVVTLYIRVGCASQVTRRYVFLSEQLSEPEPLRAPPPLAAAAPPGRTSPATAAPRSVAAAASPQRAASAPAVPVPARAGASGPESLRIQAAPRIAQVPGAAANGRSGRAPKAAQQPARSPPRLRLEPLDLAPDRAPGLRVSQQLLAEPTQDEDRRRQAAALWRAITAGPEEAVRNGERIAALEREMRAVGDQTRRNTAALELMREQTEKARGERNVMALVAIGLAVLLAAGALAFAWWSRRGGAGGPARGWWGSNTEIDSDYDSLPTEAVAPAQRAAPATPRGARDDLAPEKMELPQVEVPVRPPVATPAPVPVGDFLASYPGSSSRMLNAEELIDIQQQADFFLSIGQHERAISLLESHVQQQNDSSALAWLDLLDIYHDLGRRDDYERVRAGFGQRFNAHVPGFSEYRTDDGGLEDYGRAMSRIMTLWPTRRVLEVIEDSLLRKPGTADYETFSHEAYRELVLLFNVAKEVAFDEEAELARQRPPPPPPEPEVAPSRFGETQRMGLFINEVPPPAPAPEALLGPGELVWPGSVPAGGVDIDLGALEPLAADEEKFDIVPDAGKFFPTMSAPLVAPPPPPLAESASLSEQAPASTSGPGAMAAPSRQPASGATPGPTAEPPETSQSPLMDLDSLDWRSVR